MSSYKYHIDPGHGWLEVPISDLIDYGVRNAISGCSYRNGSIAYLEEDCDMGIFLAAYERHNGCNPEFQEHYTNNDSIIRKYRRYY